MSETFACVRPPIAIDRNDIAQVAAHPDGTGGSRVRGDEAGWSTVR